MRDDVTSNTIRRQLHCNRNAFPRIVRLRGKNRRAGPEQRVGMRNQQQWIYTALTDQGQQSGDIGARFGWQRTLPITVVLIAPRPGVIGCQKARRAIAIMHLAQERSACKNVVMHIERIASQP